MTDYKLVPKSIVDELAQFIRQVDGNHRMGAGTLADKICERFRVDVPAVQGEPVGEVRLELGAQPYVFAELYSKSLSVLAPGTKLYATPQPAEQKPAPDVAKMQRKLEASFQREEQLEREVRELKREKFKKFRGEECWIWAGDGSDELETLTCPVVIAPADLMAIINRGSPQSDVTQLVEALEALLAVRVVEADANYGLACAKAEQALAALAAHRKQGGE